MDIFKIVGQIALDGQDEFNEDINKAKNSGAGLANALGKGLATVAKYGAIALAAASAVMVAIGKTSLDAYAEYEQLVGGVETLFGDSALIVQQYASQAFQTAGLSANEYMSTVTSFSAALLQGLGGDTEEAAKIADMAITDMSDNASKMGTDMAMIQNAYQGFAKQNFTMLDNLKLGYGGTRTEMIRLLKDADRINKAHGITTQYSIDNLADIYEAIHVVQEEMGIYGTTAAEAHKTIQGSLNATKAAWKNLLVGFADGNQDLDLLIDNFVESATTAARNIVPRLAQILGGLSEAMAAIIPVIAEELPVLLEELLPGVISGAGALIQGLISALPELLVVLWDALGQIVSGVWDYIFVDLLGTDYDFETALSDLTAAAETAWTEIEEVWNAVGQPIWDTVQSCIETTAEVFGEHLPEMAEFVSSCFEDIDTYWNETLLPCLEAIGTYIEETLGPAFEEVFETVVPEAVKYGFQQIVDQWDMVLMPALEGITLFLTGVFTQDWKMAWQGLTQTVDAFSEESQISFGATAGFLSAAFEPAIAWFNQKFPEVKPAADTAMAGVKTAVSGAKNFFTIQWNKAVEWFKEKWEYAKQIVSGAWDGIKGFFSDAVDVGGKIVSDIQAGIEAGWDALTTWFGGIWDGLFGNLTANVTVQHSGSGGSFAAGRGGSFANGSHADGLDYVPFDGYIAELHKGEMVVPAAEAMVLRNGVTGTVANSEIASILTMILEAVQEGNNRETVLTLNNREFGRAVRGVAHA